MVTEILAFKREQIELLSFGHNMRGALCIAGGQLIINESEGLAHPLKRPARLCVGWPSRLSWAASVGQVAAWRHWQGRGQEFKKYIQKV